MPTLSLYFTAGGVRELITNADFRSRVLELMEDLEIEIVYLEAYRGGSGLLSEEELLKAKELMEEGGFKVRGGLCIGTWNTKFGKRAIDLNGEPSRSRICLSSEESKRGLEIISRRVAAIFNEVLIDDFWNNYCYCEGCLADFSRKIKQRITRKELVKAMLSRDRNLLRAWELYSRELLVEVSKNYVIKPAREMNPSIRIYLKFPEWYERFNHCGLDIESMSSIFDGLYVGTESRESTEQYGSFFLTRYIYEASRKLRGVWFDALSGYNFALPIGVNRFIDQLVMSLLALAKEVVLFSAITLASPTRAIHMDHLKKEYASCSRVVSEVENETPQGIPAIPVGDPSSFLSPESYIFDLLGNIAVPLRPISPYHLERERALLVTGHVLNFLNLPEYVKAGRTVILTSEAVKRIVEGAYGTEGFELLGIRSDESASLRMKLATGFKLRNKVLLVDHRSNGAVPLGPALNLKDGEIILLAYTEDGSSHPAIFHREYGRGHVYVVLTTVAPKEFKLSYPESVRDVLRTIVGEIIGIYLTASRSLEEPYRYRTDLIDVSLHPYSNFKIVIRNMNECPVRAWLHVKKRGSKTPSIEGVFRVKVEAQEETESWVRARILVEPRATCLLKVNEY